MQSKKRRYVILGFLFAALIGICLFACFKFKNCAFINNDEGNTELSLPEEPPFSKGETIIYNVNLFGIKIGESHLLFSGKTTLGNLPVELIILSTNVINLQDEEKIYVDSQTFLPLRVERKVVFFGKKMDIIEEHDQKNNLFTLTKTESGKTTKEIVKSDKPMQNIISLIFLFRKSKIFEIGEEIPVALPLVNLKMKVTSLVDFNTANNKYKAYLFESVPSKYRIWIDEGKYKIPLRLDGAAGFGNTAMVMTKFIPGEN